jgi:hypothetical protein
LETQATYANWDFTNTWAIANGSTFPYLKWQVGRAGISDDYTPVVKHDYDGNGTFETIALDNSNIPLVAVEGSLPEISFDVTPPTGGNASVTTNPLSLIIAGTNYSDTVFSTSQSGIQAVYFFNVSRTESGPAPVYSVTFKFQDEVTADSIVTVTNTDGYKLTQPANGIDYDILGWYTDAAYTNKWNFTTDLVVADTTLYAKLFWGKGTVEKPYLIHNQPEIEFVRTNLTANFKLTNDIALDLTAAANGWTPIEDYGPAAIGFTGTFDGDNHKITGLWTNSSNYAVGLFGYVKGGSIKNLGIEVATGKNITGGSMYGGGLKGYFNGGSVENSYIIGSQVTSGGQIGGLIGGTAGTVGVTISNCYAAINVAGTGATGAAGGLIGAISHANSIIQNSYATGNVTNSGAAVGGLVGQSNAATIKNSYATGSVSSTNALSENTGGLVGNTNGGSVENSYAVGVVTTNTTAMDHRVGSLIGSTNTGTVVVTNSFALANGDQPALGYVAEGVTLTATTLPAAELKQATTYTAWDFTSNWGIYEEYGYPYVKNINNYILISPEGAAYEYTGSAIALPTTLTWTASANYDAATYPVTGALAYSAGTLENAGDSVSVVAGTVDLNNPHYQISFKDDVVYTVVPAAQTITFELVTTLYKDSTYTLSASSTSGLPVVFKLRDADAAIAEIQTGNKLVLKQTGTIEVTAYVVHNNNYVDAAEVTQTRTVTVAPEVAIHSLQTSGLKAAVINSILKVGGLTFGETLQVYSIQGSTIYRQTAVTTEKSINLPAHGVYVVVSGEKKIKVVY